MKKILIIFNADSFGGSELLFMRVFIFFLELGLEVTAYGDGVQIFLEKYAGIKLTDSVRYNLIENENFDYIIFSGIAINNIKHLSDLNIKSDRCLIWAFGESGFLENILFGLGMRYRFKPYISYLFSKCYKIVFYKRYREALEFINFLLKKKSLYFSQIDGITSARDSKKIYEEDLELILPIPIPENVFRNNIEFLNDNILAIGWLGRITFDFKVYSLIKAIEDSIEYSLKNNLKLKFVIIGSGEALDFLVNFFKDKPVRLDIQGFMPPNDALEYLSKNVEFMIGMGTASLDAASVGLPSIVINASKSLKTARFCSYRWLHDSVGYSTGEFIEFGNSRLQKNNSLQAIINDYIVNKEHIKIKSVEFIKKFYLNRVFNLLYLAIKKSNLTCESFIKKYNKIYKTNSKLKNLAKIFRG